MSFSYVGSKETNQNDEPKTRHNDIVQHVETSSKPNKNSYTFSDRRRSEPVQNKKKITQHTRKAAQHKEAVTQKQKNSTGLPDNLKSGMESLSGKSLDHVQVHYNSEKPATVQAHAYAQGNEIHLASGQEKHLPHELGHVVQQMEGRVKPTTTVSGQSVNDNQSLENEATAMGNKALQRQQDTRVSHSTSGAGAQEAVVQCWPPKKKGYQALSTQEDHFEESDEESVDEVDEAEPERAQKIIAIAKRLRGYYDIHRNYKKYEKELNSKTWNILQTGWNIVNKILSLVEKIDPSGITAVINKVSALLKQLFTWISEANKLQDEELREQCTPLLPKGLDFSTVKDAVLEAKSGFSLAYDAVEAIVSL